MAQSDRTRRLAPSVLGVLVVASAALCLVLALSSDPGSGTATNLQPAADAAGLVVGAHHAKPVPPSGAAVLGLVLLAAAAATLLSGPALGNHPIVAVEARRADHQRLPRQRWIAVARAWRAPPASVA